MSEQPINEPAKTQFKLTVEVLDTSLELSLVVFNQMVEQEIKNLSDDLRELFYVHYRGPKPAPIQEEETTP